MFFVRNIIQKSFLQKSFLGLLGLFLFLFYFKFIETEDVWWHLSTGRWIIEHWQLPRVDIFPFANEVVPWSCHNEWLGSVVLFMVVKLFGLLGLKIFRSLFLIFVLGILYRYCYKRLPFSFLIIFTLLVAFGISGRSLLKPDLFNIFFVQILLMNLFEYQEKGNRRNLWAVPFVMAIWFNIHLGALIYGMSLIGIFFLSACIQYFKLNLGQNDPVHKVNAKRKVKDLALILPICLASFIFNPYGIEGFLYPFKVLLIPNYLSFYKFAPTVGEMAPPLYIFQSLNYLYYFVLFALGAAVLFLNRQNNLTSVILLIFSTIAFLYVGRNSAFFTIVCAYVIVMGVKQIDLNGLWRGFRFSRAFDYVLYFGTALYLIAQITTMWLQESYINGQLINNRFIEDEPFSDGAIKSLVRNKIVGPVFNTDLLGGEMIWLGYPGLRPFRDGRNNSYERSYNYLVALFHPRENWPKAEERYDFKIVVLRQNIDLEGKILKYLSTQPTWQLVGINGPLVTYVKRGAFNLSKQLDGFEGSLKARQYFTVDDLRKLKSLNKERNLSFMQRLSLPAAVNTDLYLNFQSEYMLGYQGAAVEDLIEALKISDQPEMRNAANFILKQYPNIH